MRRCCDLCSRCLQRWTPTSIQGFFSCRHKRLQSLWIRIVISHRSSQPIAPYLKLHFRSNKVLAQSNTYKKSKDRKQAISAEQDYLSQHADDHPHCPSRDQTHDVLAIVPCTSTIALRKHNSGLLPSPDRSVERMCVGVRTQCSR